MSITAVLSSPLFLHYRVVRGTLPGWVLSSSFWLLLAARALLQSTRPLFPKSIRSHCPMRHLPNARAKQTSRSSSNHDAPRFHGETLVELTGRRRMPGEEAVNWTQPRQPTANAFQDIAHPGNPLVDSVFLLFLSRSFFHSSH